MLLFQPTLHQLNFQLLVGDDFLRESAHLRILAVQELCFRHVDRRLMMRKHQSDKIDIAIAGSFYAPMAMCILSMLAISSDQSTSAAA